MDGREAEISEEDLEDLLDMAMNGTGEEFREAAKTLPGVLLI